VATDSQGSPAGERYTDELRWEDQAGDTPHVWHTLGFRRPVWEPGHTVVEWDAGADYSFPTPAGPIMHGGLVTTILDSAMGGACWTVLDHHELFLTADLRVEFMRAARPGLLRADGWVERRTQRMVFCSADVADADGRQLASARATQVVLPAEQAEPAQG
jgi:uncharacterized protein (TIGR00369 family)